MAIKRDVSQEGEVVIIISPESKKRLLNDRNRAKNSLFLTRCSTSEALVSLEVKDVENYKPIKSFSSNRAKENSIFLTRRSTAEALEILHNPILEMVENE